MSKFLPLIMVLVAGLIQPYQVAMNTKLNKVAGSPPVAGFVTFAGGAVVCAVLWLLGVMHRGQPSALSGAPWWAWLTGPVGVIIIFSALIALPISGAALVVTVMVFGQAAGSMVLDHYGWMDVKRVPINVWRVLGLMLILGGTLLMAKHD